MKVEGNSRLNGFLVLASFALIAGILYIAKAVFIPIAVATLLTFLLTPLVVRLQRWKFPKAISVGATVALAFAVIGFVAWLISAQLLGLAEQLPKYEQNLHAKIQRLRGPELPGVFTRAANVIQGVQRDLEKDPPSKEPGEVEDREQPVPVEVKAPRPTSWQLLRRAIGPVMGPLATAGIVALLVIVMLFKREDLRDRFIKVISGGQLNVATEAVDDGAQRISRYLFMQLVVNVTYGIPVGIGLYFIGVPSALLWGLLATLLRFIPFVGPWVAAAFPVAVAFAVDPGWTKLLLTIGLFIAMELISNNLVEPWLYGASTGVSVTAVIGAAIFWTWLWGPVGLFLAMPLTVCLVVMGKYVPGLRFLSDLLGSEPVLELPARFYQRMLAMDADEMLQLAEDYLEQHSLADFYDQVMIPALILAEEDRHKGRLAEVRQQFILQYSRELIDDLGERDNGSGSMREPTTRELPHALCIAARDDADELVAHMLAQLLEREGVPTTVLPPTATLRDCAERARDERVAVTCVSALPPAAWPAARRWCRNLARSCPGLKLFAGIWSPAAQATELAARFKSAPPEGVVTSLREAVPRLKPVMAEPRPANQPADSSHLRSGEPTAISDPFAFSEVEPEALFEAVKRETAKLLRVPISMVSVLACDLEFWKAHVELPSEIAEGNEALRNSSICTRTNTENEALIVEDAAKDARFTEDPFLEARGIKFCAALPLRARNEHTVGRLCVLDTAPRSVSPHQLALWRTLAERFMAAVEARHLEQVAA